MQSSSNLYLKSKAPRTMARGRNGGSQLAQLKSSVKIAGINDSRQQSASSKKRKRGNTATERDKAAARRAALVRIASDNPFEQKITKLKHDVLGRKVKGAVGHPSLAKQDGLAQRRATLLPEYQNRNKSGTFIDRRFGEADGTLTPEERMLERFTRERQRQHQNKGKKAALFNLNNDEGQEEELTHFGRSLSGMDNLPGLSMTADDGDQGSGVINAFATAQDHFGGFLTGPPDEPKSKAEVMREVMAKSKMHRIERQQMRSADDELRVRLDDELGDIRALLVASNSNIEVFKAAEKEDSLALAKPSSSDYDAYVRELAFERRAKPQDRLKTEAEVAGEEAEELRKAEIARLRRMRGEALGADADGASRRCRAATQGDDLEDDLDTEGQTAAEIYGLGSGPDQATSYDGQSEDSVEEDEGEEDKETGEQDAALEEDGCGTALDDDDDDGSDSDGLVSTSATSPLPRGASEFSGKVKSTIDVSRAGSVPFIFDCPLSHKDFLSILSKHSLRPAQVPLVVRRIRALHHPSLAENNKFKLQAFVGVLLDHALYSASQAVGTLDQDERSAHLALVDHLLKPIFELTAAYPMASAEHFIEKLALMERNLSKGLAKGAVRLSSRTWPGLAELTLLRITGLVWPTSDLSHVVTAPLALLEAHYLAHGRVRSYADLASGLFLVSLIFQQQSGQGEAQRFMPEALNFTHNALMLLLPLSSRKSRDAAKSVCDRYAIPTPDFGEEYSGHLAHSSPIATPAQRPDLISLLAAGAEIQRAGESAVAVHDSKKSADLLELTSNLICQLADLYKGTSAFVEIFEPFKFLLDIAEKTGHWAVLTQSFQRCRDTIRAQLDAARQLRRPLRLHAHRAIPLASFVPKFDEGGWQSRVGRVFDPDTARAETAKLRALYKKEKKGAVRELRRDAQFLAEHRAEERRKENESYKRKMGKIMAALGEERGEEKRLQREKDRIKRRAAGGR